MCDVSEQFSSAGCLVLSQSCSHLGLSEVWFLILAFCAVDGAEGVLTTADSWSCPGLGSGPGGWRLCQRCSERQMEGTVTFPGSHREVPSTKTPGEEAAGPWGVYSLKKKRNLCGLCPSVPCLVFTVAVDIQGEVTAHLPLSSSDSHHMLTADHRNNSLHAFDTAAGSIPFPSPSRRSGVRREEQGRHSCPHSQLALGIIQLVLSYMCQQGCLSPC